MDQYTARVVRVSRPIKFDSFSGSVGPGRFSAGPHVRFDGADVESVDFSGLKFETFRTEGSTFIGCDFSRVRVEAGVLDPSRTSTFIRCRFDRLRPGALIWGGSRFEDCVFDDLRLKDWRLASAEFVRCSFSGRIDGLSLWGCPPPPNDQPDRLSPFRTRNEFRGNDFSRVDLRFPEFRDGVDVSANIWPSGPEYLYLDRWQERLRRAGDAVATWADVDERARAHWWIGLHQTNGREAQDQILVRLPDWENIKPTTTWNRLWSLLSEAPTVRA